MAVVAALLASVTLMGHRLHTEETVQQTKAADGWAFFQAKRVRSAIQEDLDLRGGLRFVDSPRTEDYVDATALARRIEAVARELGWALPTQQSFESIRR